MLTLFSFSAMEYVGLSIRHISCQYASVSVVTTTQVTSPVAYYRPDSTSWCIVIREPAYQWLMARGMCIICIYAVSISLGHILVLCPHGSDSRTCLYIRQIKWHDDYSKNGNCCFLCSIHFEDICAIQISYVAKISVWKAFSFRTNRQMACCNYYIPVSLMVFTVLYSLVISNLSSDNKI